MRFGACGLLFVCGLAVAAPADLHLDVVVRDGRGRIVRDLEGPDVAVFENGASVAVRSVHLSDPKQRRLLCLLFDRMSGEAAHLSREAALELVKAAAKSNVAIALFAADPKFSVRQSFTMDQKSLRAAIESMTGSRHAPAPGGPVETSLLLRIVRANSVIERETRTRPSIMALLSIVRGLSAEPGRKAVVYFSQGLPVDPRQEGFREMLSAANRAAVAVYTVDAGGLATSRDEEVRRTAAMQSVMRASGVQAVGREAPGGGPPTTVYEQTPISADRVDNRADPHRPPSALAALAQGTGGFAIAESSNFRTPIRRVPEDLTSYYEVQYAPADTQPDSRFRATQVKARNGKLAVQGREGYFATPDLSGRPALPYELVLLEALGRTPAPRDFTHQAAVLRFRSADTTAPAPAIMVEMPVSQLEFQPDDTAGVFRAQVSVMALVRDATGAIVDRFGSETPLLSPPGMLDEVRKRDLALGRQLDLAPGNYTLETAIHDRIAGRFSTNKIAFAVAPVPPRLELSSVSVVRSVTASPADGERDAAFHLENKTVQPALDGIVSGGSSATSAIYFQLYPSAGSADPVDLTLEVVSGSSRVAHHTLQVKPANQKAVAELLSLDLSKLAPGPYELRVVAAQGGNRVEEQTRLTIVGGAAAPSEVADVELRVQPAPEPRATPPTADQQQLLEATRESALKYSEKLPNFICTQSTRRILDPSGNGAWRTVEESSDLLSFYDSQEHYSSLTSRSRSAEGEWPASVTSAGEFGSLLKQIFNPISAARFGWLRIAQLRGRQLQVFSYSVDAAHSRYRATYRNARQMAAVFPAFHGEVWVDTQTATVQHLTFETESLPASIPIRQISLLLDYDDVAVADKVYLLPIAVTIDVRLHKSTVARNEVSFRSYQRFSSDSRVQYR